MNAWAGEREGGRERKEGGREREREKGERASKTESHTLT